MIAVYVQDTDTGESFDISTLINVITIDSYLNGQPGKLTCTIQEDPHDTLTLSNGSKIVVIADGYNMFYGYITELGTDATKTYQIVAYDQMFYLKNPIIIETKNQTASQIFETICKREKLKYEIKHPSKYICPKQQHIEKTCYSVIEYGLNQTLIAKKKMFFIRDNFGKLTFYDADKEITNLVIGEGSLLSSYKYTTSISDYTANAIKVYRIDEKTGRLSTWNVIDSTNIKRWGKLRHIEQGHESLNEAELKELAESLLKQRNKPFNSMKLSAIGVKELMAGSGFTLKLDRLGLKENMWIKSITHTITKDLHTMDMEVYI